MYSWFILIDRKACHPGSWRCSLLGLVCNLPPLIILGAHNTAGLRPRSKNPKAGVKNRGEKQATNTTPHLPSGRAPGMNVPSAAVAPHVKRGFKNLPSFTRPCVFSTMLIKSKQQAARQPTASAVENRKHESRKTSAGLFSYLCACSVPLNEYSSTWKSPIRSYPRVRNQNR